MSKQIYPWQRPAWEALQQLRARLPHAILLHGTAGTGKREFAARFAQSLLCEVPLADGQPCDHCDACGWFDQYSHPDYRRVRPAILDEGDSDADGDADATDKQDSAAPEAKKAGRTTKTPSKDIRIEQIRALSGLMNISTHRNGNRVVLLYPAESLNGAAANALLKTLEEPPPRTVLILVTHRIDRLLPTILSRCLKLALPMPSRPQALAWLATQQIADADQWLDEQGGAPLAALAEMQAGRASERDALLRYLAQPTVPGALALADTLLKTPIPDIVAWLQRWLYDVFACQLSGTIRYYPRRHKELAALAARADTTALMAALQSTAQRRAVAEHPLAPKLFIEDTLLDYARLFS